MKKNNKQSAFTLMELLLVMGVVAILAIASISVWRNNRNRIMFSQSKNDVILALEKARSRAEIGYQKDGTSTCQGVSVDGLNLVISERCGVDCSTMCGDNDKVYLAASVVNSSDFPINFKRITAETVNKDIVISYGSQTSTIRVKSDGAIYEITP